MVSKVLWRGEDPRGVLIARILLPLRQPTPQLLRQHCQGFSHRTPSRLPALRTLLLQRWSLPSPRSLRPGLPWNSLRPIGSLPPGAWNPGNLLSAKETLLWVFRHWAFVVDCDLHASNTAVQAYRSQLVVRSPKSHKQLFILPRAAARKPKVKWLLLLFLKKAFQWSCPSLGVSDCSSIEGHFFWCKVWNFRQLWTELLSLFFADFKRDLLDRAPYPEDSKSPYDFDPYTLNHAAKVSNHLLQCNGFTDLIFF